MLVVGPRNKQVMVCPLVKVRKQEFRGKQGGGGVWSKEVLCLGHAQCSKFFADGPINLAPFFKKLKSWGKDFFHFSLVPNAFTVCSLQVPKMFPKMFSIAPHFYPICFGECCPLFTYIVGPRGRNSIFQNRTIYPHIFFFF